MNMPTRPALALAGATIALALALSGCSSALLGADDAQRDEDGNVTEESTIDIFALKVGDCMPANETMGEIQEADVVPCDGPHTDEVFFEFELAEGELPSEEAITAEVEAQCVPAFADFVGFDYYESTLDFWWITPTADTWEQADDRLVQCVIFEPDPADETGRTPREIEGSLKAAAR